MLDSPSLTNSSPNNSESMPLFQKDSFEHKVFVSNDGKTVLMGANTRESITGDYESIIVYRWNDFIESWDDTDLLALDKKRENHTAEIISLASDGNTIVILAYGLDAMGNNSDMKYIFKWNTKEGSWERY